MSKDFTVDELYECIRYREDEFNCGYDELLLLLADYIDDERITKEINKYVDDVDEYIRREDVCLQEMKELLEKHLTTIEIIKGVCANGSKVRKKREKLLELSSFIEKLLW